MREVAIALALASGLAGCDGVRGEFACVTSGQCRRGEAVGTCEPAGFCAFGDGTCPSGRRYDDTAAAGLAGQCVDPAAIGDAGVDAVALACPADYAPIGSTGTFYRVVTAPTAEWRNAYMDCENDGPGSHLVTIDSDAENTALAPIANEPSRWVGTTDGETEGTWLHVVPPGVPAWPLPWAQGYPREGSRTPDCAAIGTAGLWKDVDCDSNLPYVCECDGLTPTLPPVSE